MENIRTTVICDIVYKLLHGQTPNVRDYPQEILKELHKAKIIDGWPNAQGDCIMIRKGNDKIFDNAVKKHLNIKSL